MKFTDQRWPVVLIAFAFECLTASIHVYSPIILLGMSLFPLLGGALGFAAHHGCFIRGEWHVQSPALVASHCIIFLCLQLSPALTGSNTFRQILRNSLGVFYGYLTGLTISIILYRLFFHRLTRAGFPGPWYSPTSNIWNVWASRDRKYYLTLHGLHQKYGDFVRTGPAEVAVFHPDIFTATDGPRSECIKSEFYDVLLPRASLLTTRDKPLHAVRRREWNTGFSSRAVAVHMSRILPYVDRLESLISADAGAGRASQMSDYLYWFGFDAMGEFVFSRPFGMLESREMHQVIKMIQSALSFVGPLIPASWIVHVGLHLLPRVSKVRDWFDSLDWCEQQMRRRVGEADVAQCESRRDLTYYLMEEERNRHKGSGVAAKDWNMSWMGGDSLLAIIAGSDPSTSTLIGAFCELGRHPEHVERIHQELAQVEDVNDIQQLRRLPHLKAVINETMRLYPALLSGGSRKTTAKGITVAGRYIPAHTTIISPRYTISRRADCFEQPEDFVPERWTTRPEMTRNSTAFSPFGTGAHSCLGRVLAEDMMMCVIAKLVKKYRIRLAPGETGRRVVEEMTDQFVPYPGPLSLTFELRAT